MIKGLASSWSMPEFQAKSENGGAKVGHGSGGIVLLRAA
jgi:hypothetical protein